MTFSGAQNQKPIPRPVKSNPANPNPPAKKVIPNPVIGGGNSGKQQGGGGNGGNGQPPSPWLEHSSGIPKPDPSASFVEYLRWMRSLDQSPNYKDVTKTQILQMAQEGVDYRKRLETLNQRTKAIASFRQGECIKVLCPWRIRVGGHRGPESTLLPSFDALGVPYLPSSTLTGVARAAAIQEYMADRDLSWKDAEKAIAPYFGSIETTDNKNKAGKVIFLDAYPEASKSAGLAMDMANSIWRWDGDRIGDYSPKPNSFFSLKDVTFVVGICRMSNCDDKTLAKVKAWLIKGLQSGIGSQINSGYGEGMISGQGVGQQPFFEVNFELEGQLIHGAQKFENVNQPFRRDNQGRLKPNQKAVAEVRAIAFKSMLRYWFRAISRGLMSAQNAKIFEGKIFGAIDPQSRGWLTVRVHNPDTIRDVPQRNNEDVGLQSGTLALYYSSECPVEQQEDVKNLAKSLTWLMFGLGGVGQGARRPCYSRFNRQYAPWYRGAQIYVLDKDVFWKSPETMQDFQNLFRNHLQNLCSSLSNILGQNLNLRTLQALGESNRDSWYEVLDLNCRIVVCSGSEIYGKPHGLAILHSDEFKRNGDYNPDLCGSVRGKVKPSPIWINDQGDYQVVTIFGASSQADNPRYRYLQRLQTGGNSFLQIFPVG
jgi:CRISPR-associated protein Cmr6